MTSRLNDDISVFVITLLYDLYHYMCTYSTCIALTRQVRPSSDEQVGKSD